MFNNYKKIGIAFIIVTLFVIVVGFITPYNSLVDKQLKPNKNTKTR